MLDEMNGRVMMVMAGLVGFLLVMVYWGTSGEFGKGGGGEQSFREA